MNKRKLGLCAALAAAAVWPGCFAAEASGEVVWVLTGTASEADGSAVRIAVPDSRAPMEEEPAEPVAAASANAVPEAAAPAVTERSPAETVNPSSVPAEAGGTVEAEKRKEAPVQAVDAEMKRVSAAQGTEATLRQEDAVEELAAAQRADMDQRKLAALQQMQPADSAEPADKEKTSEVPDETVPAADTAETGETSDGVAEEEKPPVSGEADSAAAETERVETSAESTRSMKEEDRDDAEKEKGPDASISPDNPMVVTADAMAYRGMTGDVDVRGHVDITHMQDRYQTEHVYGNSNTQQYVIPGKVKWTSPGNEMTAERGTYDGKTAVATFDGIKGWNQGIYYYEGESGVYNRTDNTAVVQKGFFTTKHAVAKVPDYRIEADSIDIYPGDHYKAHNVGLYFKNTKVLTLSSYSGSLKDGTNLMSLIPSPTFDSDNGWGLKNRLVLPVGGPESDLYFDARLAWYSKEGFKPDVGLRWNTAPGTFRFRYAEEESTVNDDHVWVEKYPSFSFDSRHFYIPSSNFYVGARGEIGHWKEGRISGSHKLWDVYLSHDAITFGPHLRFNWRLGYLRDYYGYNDSIRSNRYYSLGLRGSYGIISSWINYTDNNQNGRTPYHFDTYDMDKPVNTGFRVQLTSKDAVSVSWSVDTIDGELEHRYFTYYRDMHSFNGWIRYDTVDEDFEFMISPKDFSF